MDMDEKEYLEQRVEDQISWYDRKSQWNQKWFRILCALQFVAAALVPFLAPYITADTPKLKVSVGLLGVLIAVLTSVIGLLKLQEHWMQYRTTCESLRHEKFLYLTHVSPYDTDDAFDVFVQRIESLSSRENSAWASLMRYRKEKKGA